MNILVFGDSNGCGWSGAKTGGWVDILHRGFIIDHLSNDRYVNIYNLSIDGDTSDELRKRFRAECDPRSPDVVILAIGLNDGAVDERTGERSVRKDRFNDNMSTILEWASNRANRVLVLGLARVDEARTRPVAWDCLHYHNAIGTEYNELLRNLADASGAQFIEFPTIDPQAFPDGLHLDDEGHLLVAQTVLQALKPAITPSQG